jgi:hypothetical protein
MTNISPSFLCITEGLFYSSCVVHFCQDAINVELHIALCYIEQNILYLKLSAFYCLQHLVQPLTV